MSKHSRFVYKITEFEIFYLIETRNGFEFAGTIVKGFS